MKFFKEKRRRRFIAAFAGVSVVALTIGLSVGLTGNDDEPDISSTSTTSTTTSTTTTTTQPLPAEGWTSWSEWTGCSVSCGQGEVVRSRECIVMHPGTESSLCSGYKGSDEIEVQTCLPDQCTSGLDMVNDLTEKALTANVDDKLFLNRYVQAVTLNGEVINDKDVGYGAWRLTKAQFDRVLKGSRNLAYSTTITNNLSSNYKVN